LIEGFLPFKESVLYVYGYVLAKCLIQRKWRIVDILLLVISSVTNFVMFYRSLLLIWFALTVILILAITRDRSRYVQGTLILFGLAFMAAGLVCVKFDEIRHMTEATWGEVCYVPVLSGKNIPDRIDASTSQHGYMRTFIWLQAIEHIRQHPLLGNGVGYEDYLGLKGRIFQIYSEKRHTLATYHNQLISFLVDYGIIGTLFLYYVFLKIGLLGVKLLGGASTSKTRAHAIYCFLVIYLIYFLSSFIGGRVIPSHPSLYTVIPIWLFMAAIVSEVKNQPVGTVAGGDRGTERILTPSGPVVSHRLGTSVTNAHVVWTEQTNETG
jgi:O-antigen ligase